ncbi:MAG: prephenate dehydrogenase [Planctomycetia bacterium]|nr:prephenate dehydrogenase [Planctomycetia bacterium]
MNTFPGNVVLIGIGLLGGSIAMAIRRYTPETSVRALKYRPETGFTTVDLKTVYPDAFDEPDCPFGCPSGGENEKTSGCENVDAPADLLRHADLIVVCTPVQTIATIVRCAAQYATEKTLITDVGSTKREIVMTLETAGPLPNGVRYLGSHPIAGSDRSGPMAADPDLLKGKVVAVTPTERSLAGDLRNLQRFWESLGAVCETLTPVTHDRILARTSHLPHFVAAILALCISEKDKPFLGTGFRDTTRIAAGLASLWVPIFRSNREPLLDAVTELQVKLTLFREAIEADDEERMNTFLTTAEKIRCSIDGTGRKTDGSSG